jgi:hypothetical protein
MLRAFAERTSEQDTKLFKIRYEYKGSMSPEDHFVVKWWAQIYFRKEDIELASKGVNKGLVLMVLILITFSIQSGVNCKHFWQRSIF